MISALSPFSYGEVWELAVMHQNYSSLEPKMTQLQGFKVLGGVRDFKVPVAGSGLITKCPLLYPLEHNTGSYQNLIAVSRAALFL